MPTESRYETMNCKDYRHRVAADPSFDGGAAHLSECPGCQAFRTEMLSLDSKIAAAMQIDVPDLKLPDLPTIDADNIVALATRRPRLTPGWLAVAATVVLAAAAGVRMVGVGAGYDSLAEEVLAHLDHEPASLRPSTTAVSEQRLTSVVPAGIAHLDHSAGLITYAQSCDINGKTVPHLVLQGVHGPITILLMPDEPVAKAETLDGKNVHGVILPVGDGSIAIMGPREERLERVEKSILKSVKWAT